MFDIDTLLDRIMSAILVVMGLALVGLPLAIVALE
jgi:hypothetical protein